MDYTVVCYHWENGAYINGMCYDFERLIAGLVSQFGAPCRVSASLVSSTFQ